MDEIVLFGRAIAHPARVRVLKLLLDSQKCTCELAAALSGTNRSSLDKHLEELIRLSIVESGRSGRWMHYEIKPHLKPVLRTLFDAFPCRDVWDFKDDMDRLSAFSSSPNRIIC